MPPRKTRVIAAGLVIGLTGLLTMIAINLLQCGVSVSRCFASGNELMWPAAIGAALAGMLFYALFGQEGEKGWMLAALGAVLATAVGAILAVGVMGIWGGEGLFDNPSIVLFGPVFVAMMFAQYPVTFFLWIGIMAGAHLVLRRFLGNTHKCEAALSKRCAMRGASKEK